MAADNGNCIKILVKTGHGNDAKNVEKLRGIAMDYIASDLLDGVKWLIENYGSRSNTP